LAIAGWYANRIADRDPPTYDKFGKATNTRMFQGRGRRLLPWPGGRDAEVFVALGAFGQAFARFAIALGKAR